MIGGILFTLAGLILSVTCYVKSDRALDLMDGKTVYAPVVEIISERKGGNPTMYRPVVIISGERAWVNRSVGDVNEYRAGKKIRVRYIEGDLSTVQIDSFWGIWMTSIISFILSLLFLLCGLSSFKRDAPSNN